MGRLSCERLAGIDTAFVPTKQVLGLYDVYVLTQAERVQVRTEGFGCVVTDKVTGEQQKVKLSALHKSKTSPGFRHAKSGKRVRAGALIAGKHYTVTAPCNRDMGVFVVVGRKHDYSFNDVQVPAGSCIVTDGKGLFVVPGYMYRKLFVTQKNPVSRGELRVDRVGVVSGLRSRPVPQAVGNNFPQRRQVQPAAGGGIGFDAAFSGMGQGMPQQKPVQQAPQMQRPVQPVAQPQKPVQPQATTPVVEKYTIMGRYLRGGALYGLRVRKGSEVKDMKLDDCIEAAKAGKLEKVKAVTIDGTVRLQGYDGLRLSDLPTQEI